MKTHPFRNNVRRFAGGIVAAGLGLSGMTALAAQPAATPTTANTPSDKNVTTTDQNWQNHFFDQMTRMQEQMDKLFQDSVQDLNAQTKDLSLPAHFNASASVQDRGNDYVANFYLPHRDLSNVKVNINNDMLTVNASAEQTTKSNKKGGGSETMLNQYEQIVTLPGPVDAAKMKVDKKNDSVIVTVPKAEKEASTK
ncbi:MAG TPA: Hsp20/alpha crystallin family protein [Chthoniobacteraceae bacterium]|jgi:HSP20 family molecular chaperone IbpA|nr:Hsp20/alpha crystallin family protein [Chthoniobacteraceae bacterium]